MSKRGKKDTRYARFGEERRRRASLRDDEEQIVDELAARREKRPDIEGDDEVGRSLEHLCELLDRGLPPSENKHHGASFDSFLKEQGIFEEVDMAARARAFGHRDVRKFILVGQDPALPRSGGMIPPLFEGATSRRLVKLLGIRRGDYLDGFDRVNLVGIYMGRNVDNGNVVPQDSARGTASDLLKITSPFKVIVALGRGVARAFGLPPDVEFFRRIDHNGRVFFVSPHPSGKSRWWKDKGNRGRARRFYRRLGAEAMAWAVDLRIGPTGRSL